MPAVSGSLERRFWPGPVTLVSWRQPVNLNCERRPLPEMVFLSSGSCPGFVPAEALNLSDAVIERIARCSQSALNFSLQSIFFGLVSALDWSLRAAQ